MIADKINTSFINYKRFFQLLASSIYPYYQKTRKDPRWLLMYATSRFVAVRSFVNFVSQKPSRRKYDVEKSVIKNVSIKDAVDSLKKDRFYSGILLPNNIVEEILFFAENTRCYVDGDPQLGFFYSEKDLAVQKCGRKFLRAEFYNTSLLCPTIKRVTNDPTLWQIATEYLGKEPACVSSRLNWLFTADGNSSDLAKAAMAFHYDLEDYHSLIFFFYITDVDFDSGPHVFVRGSYHKKKLRHLLSVSKQCSEKEIIEYYGAENIVSVCGESGFGFAEDTFCIHKATPPLRKDRLMLQVKFGINNYGGSDVLDSSLLKNCQ